MTDTVETITETSGDLVGGAATVFDTHYVVPHGSVLDTIHYRSDVLERLGLDPPETLAELLHNARVIDESDAVDARGFALPGSIIRYTDAFFRLVLYAHGGDLWKWTGPEARTASVWCPEEILRDALAYVAELAEYSIAPTTVTRDSLYESWATGEVAQAYHQNGMLAWIAAAFDAESGVTVNTDIVAFPRKDDTDPVARGHPGFDGFASFDIATNRQGLLRCLEYMYDDPSRAAEYHRDQTMVYLPAYGSIMDTAAYRDLPVFQEYPSFLDLNLFARDEIASLQPTGRDLVRTPATMHADQFHVPSEALHQVVVAGRSPDPAIEHVRETLTWRLEVGRQITDGQF